VRLLSHRPSVLYKVEHLATESGAGDIAVEGLQLAGPGWEQRLKELLESLSRSERACLFAVRLADEQGLPLPADTLLDRSRTDWFPEFLSRGLMTPHFQPIIDLADGKAFGREALMRGKLGTTELRGAELMAAAEAHDALFSFDSRARAAALEIGLPLLPDGEILFVNLDPRAVIDVESSLRTTWPVVLRMGADPSRICLELIRPERSPDREMLKSLVNAHRERGALVGLDDLSGGSDSLSCLEDLRPDIGKIDRAITAGIQHSPARRRLVAALVECAHEQGCRVVAEGIERVDEFETMCELGVDLGQGFYFGQPTAKPMAVDPRLVRRRTELV
jgi:EAL domain-containing protein (putative c-di-GMP-specific phosphodiesterase class I)